MSNEKYNTLAFDFGASSGRAIVGSFDGEKIELSEIHRFPNDPVFVGGTMYWDVLRLFHEIKQGLLKSRPYNIKSLGIDTWGVDFGLLIAKEAGHQQRRELALGIVVIEHGVVVGDHLVFLVQHRAARAAFGRQYQHVRSRQPQLPWFHRRRAAR